MALNPAFTSSTSRKLPLAYGYVLGIGDEILNTVVAAGNLSSSASSGNAVAYFVYLLGEGEWDGPELFCLGGDTNLAGPVVDASFRKFAHFHNGKWSPKGTGNAATSTGLGEGIDAYMPNFPSPTPRQGFSGVAYVAYNYPSTYITFNVLYKKTLITTGKPTGVWRTTRCRTFDLNGNVVSYGFTCNPAWHFVDAILRYKIKPQEPPIAGLTAAEKACFNWPSIVATAARNDFILPNGNPRFFGSYIFAADTTLTNILETILRVSRSYTFTRDGQIYLCGDDVRASVFTMSLRHVVTESIQLSKKNVSRDPNQFISVYRDIDIPAVTAVDHVTGGSTGSSNPSLGVVYAATNSPFVLGDLVTYGGGRTVTVPSGAGSGTVNAYAGTYTVSEASGLGTGGPVYDPAKTVIEGAAGIFPPIAFGQVEPTIATGGYLGTNNARFSERSPTGVQHISAQKMVAAQAPGLAVQPRKTPVQYDLGNCTFDQANRVMKFERDSTLGPDTGASWKAPISGTLTAYLEAVDVNGKRLCDVNVRDVITLDDWVTPEFPGDYLVKSKPSVTAPSGDTLAMIQLELTQYFQAAYTDVSDDPGDTYRTVPGTTFKLTGFPPVSNPAWTLVATPTGALAGGKWTIAIANLVMQIGGVAGTTAYPGFSVANVPDKTNVVLFVDDPAGNGAAASYGFQPGTSLTAVVPGRYIVLIGKFIGAIPFGTTPGDASVLFEPA